MFGWILCGSGSFLGRSIDRMRGYLREGEEGYFRVLLLSMWIGVVFLEGGLVVFVKGLKL